MWGERERESGRESDALVSFLSLLVYHVLC